MESAAQEVNIDTVDLVTVMDSKLRLFRDGNYPPYRGTLVQLDDDRELLYTKGSVWYYQTYPGLYIPQPIELRIVRSEESPNFIAKEVLGLTKMNWNNTQFDGKYPVTLGCSRKVGEILKYLTDTDTPRSGTAITCSRGAQLGPDCGFRSIRGRIYVSDLLSSSLY